MLQRTHVVAAEAPAPQAPFAGSIYRSGLHWLEACYGAYVDDQPFLHKHQILLSKTMSSDHLAVDDCFHDQRIQCA